MSLSIQTGRLDDRVSVYDHDVVCNYAIKIESESLFQIMGPKT